MIAPSYLRLVPLSLTLCLLSSGLERADAQQPSAADVAQYAQNAESDDATSQHKLAVCYENGWGIEQDLDLAAQWYRRAADQDYAPAQTNLALLYDHGRGVEQDLVQAASLGDRDGQANVVLVDELMLEEQANQVDSPADPAQTEAE